MGKLVNRRVKLVNTRAMLESMMVKWGNRKVM